MLLTTLSKVDQTGIYRCEVYDRKNPKEVFSWYNTLLIATNQRKRSKQSLVDACMSKFIIRIAA